MRAVKGLPLICMRGSVPPKPFGRGREWARREQDVSAATLTAVWGGGGADEGVTVTCVRLRS